jgi:hypothetical protein
MCSCAFEDAACSPYEHGHRQANPIGVHLDGRLTHSAPLLFEKLVQIDSRVPFQPVIHSTRSLMGQDSEGFALAMCALDADEVLLPCRIVPQE